VEKVVGWRKKDRPMRQVKLRGPRKVDRLVRLMTTAHHLLRRAELIPIPAQPQQAAACPNTLPSPPKTPTFAASCEALLKSTARQAGFSPRGFGRNHSPPYGMKDSA
jgi:hypothetical protein